MPVVAAGVFLKGSGRLLVPTANQPIKTEIIPIIFSINPTNWVLFIFD